MNEKFDELAKGLAQSVTRRGALKKFGVGLVGVALATVGLPNKAEATHADACDKHCANKCGKLYPVGTAEYQACWGACFANCCQCGPH